MGSPPQDQSNLPKPQVLVGREHELEVLSEALRRAIQGYGSVVLVSGEAGIGKTSMVQMLGREAWEQNVLTLTGAAYDLSVTPPYGPWLEITDRYQAGTTLPELPEILKRGTGVGELQTQQELFELARAFFSSVSEIRPLLLVLEDLHWSDQASLDMLRYLARRIDDQRVLIIVTYRDDEIARTHHLFQLLPALIRESQAVRVELSPLGAEEVSKLIRSRWSLSPADEGRLLDHLLAHAEGNPLFTVEILRTLQQSAYLSASDDGWVLADVNAVPVPMLVQQVIERRLTQLGEDERQYLEIAAVIGHTIPLDAWQLVGEINDEALTRVVDRAVALNLLELASDATHVNFVHALTREAVYEGILPLCRRNWHLAIAETLADRAQPDPDAVAYHFERAGDPRAVYWLIRAGEQAERTFAWGEAFDRHERASNLLRKSSSDDAQLARLLLKLGRLLRFTDSRRGINYHEESREIALRCGDHAIADLAKFNAGSQLCMAGELHEGLEAMSEAVDGIVRNAENVRKTARWSQTVLVTSLDPVYSSIGTFISQLSYAGRYHQAIETADRLLPFDWREGANAIRHEQIGNQKLSFGDGYWGLGISLSALGNLHEGKLGFDIIREMLRQMNYDAHFMLVTSSYLAMHHFVYRADDLHERRSLVSEIEASIRIASGSAGWQNTSWGYEWYLLHEGRWAEMRNLINELDPPTLAVFWNTAMSARARLAWSEGRLDDAWNLINLVHPHGPVGGSEEIMDFRQRESHRIAAAIAIEAGDLDVARGWLEAHDEWLERSGVTLGRAEGLMLWGKFHLADGNAGIARQHAERALVNASDPRQPIVLMATQRFLAELSVASGDFAAADQHLQSSLELAEACALPYERALTLLALAELDLIRGERARAHDLLRDVQSTCAELGAHPVLERANALLNQYRTRRSNDKFGLTRRELEVMQLLAQGMSDKAIADKLFISPRTAMHHVSSILRKLDVDSRAAAAAQAVRHELV